MANPTGTTYLAAVPGYTWADGDIYQIPQADQQEGAAVGASFGGLGVDNQAHQILLNKVQLVHTNQLTDEASIVALNNFNALFTGLMGPNGYVRVPVHDASLGLLNYIVQWGAFLPSGGVSGDKTYTVNWNIPFPNACDWASATMRYTAGGATVNSADLGVGLTSVLGLNSGNFYVNIFNVNHGVDGFSWMAIGF